MLDLAVPTSVCRRPLKEAIHWAAELGVTGVQFDAREEVTAHEFGDSASRHLLHLLQERMLRPAALTFPLRHPLYATPALDQCVSALRGAIELGARLRVPTLILRPGLIPQKESADRQRLVAVLADLALIGAHQGVTLTLTPSGDSPEAVLELLAEFPAGLVGVDFDPAGAILNHQSPSKSLRSLHHVVRHVQFRDARRGEDGTGIETLLGQGETPWAEVLALLQEMHYTGWHTVRRTMGEQPAVDIELGVQLIRRLCGG